MIDLCYVNGSCSSLSHSTQLNQVCALMDLDCTIYMGAADCERQALNVFRMKMLGAKVHTYVCMCLGGGTGQGR